MRPRTPRATFAGRVLAALPATRRVVQARLRGRRSQDGFALMAVLFVLMLTALVVVALVGLSFTTAVFSGDQSVRDNRAQAADAALQATINEIARDTTGNLGFPYEADGTTSAADCGTLDDAFEFGEPSVDVVVECSPVDPNESNSSATGALVGTGAGDFVRVVGAANGGHLASNWKTGSWPWSSTVVDNPATPATEQWSGAAQAAVAATTPAPTLLHRGSAPLSFASSVEVSQGAAAIRQPVLTDPTGFDSAINVTGSYWQGNPGLMNGVMARDTASPAYDDNDPSNTCGILQPIASTWQVYGASIRTGSSMACSQDGGPGERDSKGLTWQSPGVIPPAPRSWTPQELAANAQTVPNCPAPGTTVQMQPGAYNRNETQKLKTRWNGSCPNVTWEFLPGDYWFDVAPSNPTNEPLRNALVINDATTKIVFGTAKSDPPVVDDFPEACDPTAPGASITLSPRTSIRHQRGRVAICGAVTNNGRQAIWQSSGANLGWVAPPSQDTGIGGDFLGNPGGALQPGGGYAEAMWPCYSPVFQEWLEGVSCDGFQTISVTHLGEDDDPGSAPVDSVQAVIRADAAQAAMSGSNVEFILQPAPERGGGQCSMSYGPLPDNFVLLAYELMHPAGSCDTLIKDRSQLVGATLTARFNLISDCWLLCGSPVTMRVDYLALRVPWTPKPQSFSVDNPGYSNPNRVAAIDGQDAERRVECDGWFFPWLTCTSSTTGILNVNDFQDLWSPELSDSATAGTTLKSLYVTITARANNVDTGGSTTTLTLRRPNGSVLCSAQFAGVPGGYSPELAVPQVYDLKNDPGTVNTCRNTINSAKDLVGASLQIRSFIRKSSDCSAILTWFGIRDCSYWGTRIDHVGVSTTSALNAPDGGTNGADAYEGPTSTFVVTSDASAGNNAVWSVSGLVSIPRGDLDVYWNGPLTVSESELPSPGALVVHPLFSGKGVYALTVGSISSSSDGSADARVGSLCCTPSKPSERQVELTARLGSSAGKIIGRARVLFSDVSVAPDSAGLWAPGQRVTVQDWRSCPAGVDDPGACGGV